MMAALPRIVLDTNVLVAAAYNVGSASRRIVEACLDGRLTAVLSPSLRREYEFILARAVRSRPYLERLHCLLEQAEVVVPEETPRVVPEDPDDDKLVAAALAASAVLVTNDAHLLAITGHNGVQVQRPAEVCVRW
jgi:putative PIN family toxin of toxin-antitoxin system